MISSSERELLERCRKDNVFFLTEVLGAEVWPFQARIADAVRQHGHVCVQACHASGKDWLAARLAVWFNSVFAPSRVVTTAPTDRQVRLILWEELTEAIRSSRVWLGGRLLTQEWKIAEKHGAVGFSTPEYTTDTFSGLHSMNMFVIYDEANGIPASIRERGAGLLAGGEVTRVLEIGNPISPTSEFAKECASPLTKTITISAFDTPNFTEFGIEREDIENNTWREKIGDEPLPAPYLITPEWVHTHFVKWHQNWTDRRTRSRILGLFPKEGSDAIFDPDAMLAATRRTVAPRKNELRVLGCDVARFGDDSTVIYLRVGSRYRRLDEWQGKKTTETTNRLIYFARKYGVHEIRVDDGGVGGGVVDELTEKLPAVGLDDVVVYRMLFGARAQDPENYYNARAEWYCELGESFDNGEIVVEHDDELFEDLRATKIKRYDGKGRRVLLEKDEIKKTLGRSPDYADALVCAFGVPTAHAPLELLGSM